MRPDRTFVVECYRRLLGREPENEAVIDQVLRGDKDMWALIALFTNSEEFRSRSARLSSYSLLKAFDRRGLARNFTDHDRMRAILGTYGALNERMDPGAFKDLFMSGLTVLDEGEAWCGVTVRATVFGGSPIDGEVSLLVSFEGRHVAVLTYTHVAADSVGLTGDDVVLVSRLQGLVGVGIDSRAMTRRLGGIAPPYLLLAVLEGIAGQSGVRIVGVPADRHPDLEDHNRAMLVAAYDDLFRSLRSTVLPSGFHLLDAPLHGRPLSAIGRDHRARTRRKRHLKQMIAQAAQARWAGYMRPVRAVG